jgi:hypothetical protein
VFGADPDTALINRPAALDKANERIESTFMCKLRRLELSTPTKFGNFLEVLREVFTVNKPQLA